MATAVRALIEASLKGMEPGRFQDFCLHFLPCFAARFVGLERYGHTAEGKTRPGVPDLIKTLPTGKQIAVECGTEEGYWGPGKKLEDLKPFQDIAKCLDVLDAPIEVVAIANHELARGTANIKSQLVQAFQHATKAQITPIDLAEISDFLAQSAADPAVKKLLIDYCPDVAPAIKAIQHEEKYRIAEDVARSQRIDANHLFDLVEKSIEAKLGPEAAREFVLKAAQGLSRCRLAQIPNFDGITRESIESSPLANPGGKISLVIGLPKIGKSAMLLELIPIWSKFEVRVFDIPADDADECVGEISSELLGSVIPSEAPLPLIKSRILRRERLLKAEKPPRPILVAVDNADHLPDAGLKILSEILADLKQIGAVGPDWLSCLFLSSKPLPLLAAADSILTAPSWTGIEIRRFLCRQLGDVPGPPEESDNYMDLLVEISGGHPLLALAVAKKCANVGELLISPMKGINPLGGEDLSREVQSFLYNELLSDSDSQNLVQRLSILVGRQEMMVLSALRRVAPAINTSLPILLDRLAGSVLERSPERGYLIPPLFREVAKKRIDAAEIREVFRVVSTEQLRPEGNVINGERAVSGILNALCGEEIATAATWTVLLIMNVLKEAPSQEALRAILQRLQVIAFVKQSEDFSMQLLQAMAQVSLAMGFQRIGDLSRAADILSRVRLTAPPPAGDVELAREQAALRSGAIVFKALCLAGTDSSAALNALEDLSPKDLAELPDDPRKTVLILLQALLGRHAYTQGISRIVRGIFATWDETDVGERHSAFLLVSSLSFRAKSDDRAKADLEQALGRGTSELLRSYCMASLLLELGQEDKSLEQVESAIQVMRSNKIESGPDFARVLLTKGDAAYRADKTDVAIDAYAGALNSAIENSFEFAWSSWRLGILQQEPQTILNSAPAFRELGLEDMWGRALGAGGALLIKLGKKIDGLRCLSSVVESYFVNKVISVGPAATVALAHLARLETDFIAGKIPNEEEIPTFESAPYENVIPTALPRSGPTLAFFTLGELFRHCGEEKEAERWWNLALSCEPSESDLFCISWLVKRVIDLAVSKNDLSVELARRCSQLLLIQDRSGAYVMRAFLVSSLFQTLDAEIQAGKGASLLGTLLKSLEEGLETASGDDAFWSAEITLRRGLIALATGEEIHAAGYFRQALHDAQESQNANVLLDAGHRLGYELVSLATSVRELAQFQFMALRGIELSKHDYSRVLTVGRNLYSIWRHCEFRRLSEYDLKAKKLLKDSATTMAQEGVSDDTAAVVMAQLLCKLYDHKGPCLDYLLAERPLPLETLPADVRQRLES